jgi:predicted GIY-YIG superfamily endonuclease
MNTYFVYVLKGQIDGTTYICSTYELDKHLREDNDGEAKSVEEKGPYEMCYYEAFSSKRLARKREFALKKNSWLKEKLFERIFE